jgi:hypothetical protein
MPSESAYVDPDLLTVAAVGLFVLAFLATFLPFALVVALGSGVVAAGLLGRQQEGLHRALFVGMAPAAGGTLAELLRLGEPSWGLTHHVGMGLTTGLLVAFFGYAVGTLEYWLADGTPSPRRRDVARFAVLVVGGLAVVVAMRLLTPDPVVRTSVR